MDNDGFLVRDDICLGGGDTVVVGALAGRVKVVGYTVVGARLSDTPFFTYVGHCTEALAEARLIEEGSPGALYDLWILTGGDRMPEVAKAMRSAARAAMIYG